VLQGGVMPVAMVRARLDDRIDLSADWNPAWRFAGDPGR
jgi:hypothetical protein